MNYMLVFDIPRESHGFQVKIWRELHAIRSKKLQHSLWSHDDLKKLTDLAIEIKNNGGRARILEERFLF